MFLCRGKDWISLVYHLIGCFIFVLVVGCQPTGPHKPISVIGEKSSPGQGGPSYQDVRPIFQNKCSMCHDGIKAPGNWLQYGDIKARVDNGRFQQRALSAQPTMPPPGSAQLTDREKSLLSAWVKNGSPENSAMGQSPASASGRESTTGAAMKPSRPEDQCMACHGAQGISQNEIWPNLAGQSEGYLLRQLNQFASGERPSDVMQNIAKSLTDSDKSEILKFFVSQKPSCGIVSQKPEDVEFIKKGAGLADQMNCINCHAGRDGQPVAPDWPIIIGQKRDYLFQQLKAFFDGTRTDNSGMQATIANLKSQGLTVSDLDALAAYFSQRKINNDCQ